MAAASGYAPRQTGHPSLVRDPSSAGSWALRTGFASAAERSRVIDWLAEGLRPEQPDRLRAEYPLLLSAEGTAIPLIGFEGDTPVAFASLWPVRFRIDGAPLRAGLVSLVYTDPRHRGRGLAARLVSAAVEQARDLGLGLVLLWSDLEGLYRPLGFALAGRERLVVVEREALARALSTSDGSEANEERRSWPPTASPVGPGDWPGIERLRGARRCRLELSTPDLERLASIPDLHVRVVRDAAGVRAFAACGRGDDLGGVIHEWGGPRQAVLACCAALLEECAAESGLFLLEPDAGHEPDTPGWALRRAGARLLRQPLAWMRIADPGAFARDLSGLLGRDLRVDPLDPLSRSIRIAGGARAGVSEPALELPTAAVLGALFGAGDAVEAEAVRERLGALLGPDVGDRLPQPFFVWGLESI